MLTRSTALATAALTLVEHALFVDVESFSEADIAKVGPTLYARHPSTEVLLVGFAVGNQPAIVWAVGDPVPAEVLHVAARPNWPVVAHNAGFDRAIWEEILTPRHGWPPIAMDRWRCTMATALALALPAGLEKLGAALGLAHQKDTAGAKLMREMTRPQRLRRGQKPPEIPLRKDPERLQCLRRYVTADDEAMREASYLMPSLPPEEQELWVLTEHINARGVPIDRALAEAGCDVAIAAMPGLNKDMASLTDGKVTGVTQVERLKAWLAAAGRPFETLNKNVIVKALSEPLNADVRRVLELRQLGGKNTPAKFRAALRVLDDDDRARDLLIFHKASTGRFSSTRVNIHNLSRTSIKRPEAAIAAVLSRDLAKVSDIAPPLELLTLIVRTLICAPPGRRLMGGDFSGIEPRVLAWIVGEKRKLQIFAEYDRSGDPKRDPYLVMISQMLGVAPGTLAADAPERQIGKTCELAFSYVGSVKAWRAFEPDQKHPLPEAEIIKFRDRWRAAHPNTVCFWYALRDAALHAMHHPDSCIRCGRVAFMKAGAHLWLRLPSGRSLCYPFARLELSAKGHEQIVCKDNAKGAWRDQRLWHGILVENVTSGIARDLLCAALKRVEAAGFYTIFHVHDEVVVELDEAAATEATRKRFQELMSERPPWGSDIQIVTKVWVSQRYVK